MTINIVHLSDLQAGASCLAEVATEGLEDASVEARYRHYAGVLAEDIRECLHTTPSDQVDLLAVTGDVANQARKEEYDCAKIFLDKLVGDLGMRWHNMAIVPGNHDVDWTVLEERFGKGERLPKTGDRRKACCQCQEKMARFSKWVNALARKHETEHIYEAFRPVIFRNVEAVKCGQFAVVGLDTSEALTHDQESNRGHVGHEQLEQAEGYLKDCGSDRIKLVLMHHNPFVHEGDDSSSGLSKPARVVRGLVGVGVRLVLAGHMHRPQYSLAVGATRSGEKTFHCLVTGPCCMQHQHRQLHVGQHTEVLPNRYQLVSIDPESQVVAVRLRQFSFERRCKTGDLGDWTADTGPEYGGPDGLFHISLNPNDDQMREAWVRVFKGLPPGFPGALGRS